MSSGVFPGLIESRPLQMVVTYFILVETVDFGSEHHRIDSASAVAGWHVLIFALYLAWDVVTKFLMYERPNDMGWWKGWRASMTRCERNEVKDFGAWCRR
jgi:hypothetical protein